MATNIYRFAILYLLENGFETGIAQEGSKLVDIVCGKHENGGFDRWLK